MTRIQTCGGWPPALKTLAEKPCLIKPQHARREVARYGVSVTRRRDGDFIKGLSMNHDEAKQLVEELHQMPESTWVRSDYCSIWKGPDLELICVSPGTCEYWTWTCVGWRTPGDAEGADKRGWVDAASVREAEKAAMKFYLQKE